MDFTTPTLPPPSPFTKRLWLAGGGWALFLLTLGLAGSFVGPDRSEGAWRIFGRDFLVAYCAGTFAREGRAGKLHDYGVFHQRQREVAAAAGLEIGDEQGPWLNPPFYAAAYAPLAALPYHAAWRLWVAVSLASLGASVVLLGRMLGGFGWRAWGLVPLGVCGSMPAVQTLGSGQSSCVSLLLLTLTVTFWRGGRGVAAGAAAGLMFFKPQLGAVVAVVLVAGMGRRAVLGLGVTGCALLLANVVGMPGTLETYLSALPAAVRWMKADGGFPWNRHATWEAFWHLLLHGRVAGGGWAEAALAGACRAAFAAGLLAAVLRTRAPRGQSAPAGPRTPQGRDRLIAAAVASIPLLMPYYVDYDLLLLAVPAVLCAREALAAGAGSAAGSVAPARWLVRAWVALYAWLFVNPAAAGLARVSLTVPLLALVAGGLVARACRRAVASQPLATPEAPATIPLRAAA